MDEDTVIRFLEKRDLLPFSVFFTYVLSGGTLAITFFLRSSLDSFLDTLGYENLCDKTGYLVFEDDCTVILSRGALTNFQQLVERV